MWSKFSGHTSKKPSYSSSSFFGHSSTPDHVQKTRKNGFYTGNNKSFFTNTTLNKNTVPQNNRSSYNYKAFQMNLKAQLHSHPNMGNFSHTIDFPKKRWSPHQYQPTHLDHDDNFEGSYHRMFDPIDDVPRNIPRHTLYRRYSEDQSHNIDEGRIQRRNTTSRWRPNRWQM